MARIVDVLIYIVICCGVILVGVVMILVDFSIIWSFLVFFCVLLKVFVFEIALFVLGG